MSLPQDPDSLVEKLKHVHLQCYFWLNALKSILPSLNIEYYGWKLRGNYNGVPMWFSGNQLPPSMGHSSETDLTKKHFPSKYFAVLLYLKE